MALTVWTGLLIILGIIFLPTFTIACILFATGYHGLGIFALIIMVIRFFSKST